MEALDSNESNRNEMQQAIAECCVISLQLFVWTEKCYLFLYILKFQTTIKHALIAFAFVEYDFQNTKLLSTCSFSSKY